MKHKNLLTLGLTAAISLSLLTGCSGGGDTVESEAPDTGDDTQITKLVVGTSADYPPFEFHILKDGVDTIVGMDISVAQAIADDMGVEMEVKDMSFNTLLTELGQGKVDMVIADTEPTTERLEAADSSDWYYEDLAPAILVLKENLDQYNTIEDFAGKTVGAQTGTNKEKIVTGTADDINMTGVTPLLLDNLGDLINQLVNNKCAALVVDGSVAKKYVEVNEDLAIVESVKLGDAGHPTVWVAKGDPKNLLPSINATIAKLKENDSVETFLAEAEALSDQAIGLD